MLHYFEFLCAQTPHSMKGLIIGLLFASAAGLSQVLTGATLTIWTHAWSSPVANTPNLCFVVLSFHYRGDSGWSSDVWDCSQVLQEEGKR